MVAVGGDPGWIPGVPKAAPSLPSSGHREENKRLRGWEKGREGSVPEHQHRQKGLDLGK